MARFAWILHRNSVVWSRQEVNHIFVSVKGPSRGNCVVSFVDFVCVLFNQCGDGSAQQRSFGDGLVSLGFTARHITGDQSRTCNSAGLSWLRCRAGGSGGALTRLVGRHSCICFPLIDLDNCSAVFSDLCFVSYRLSWFLVQPPHGAGHDRSPHWRGPGARDWSLLMRMLTICGFSAMSSNVDVSINRFPLLRYGKGTLNRPTLPIK